jgi:mycofactocin system glycosyltransferase
VDDASLDPGAVGAVARSHGASVIHLDHNVGPAAARNIGLARVSTPYVAFVDSDVVVTADTLLGLTAHFNDPLVALVAPNVRARVVSTRPGWFERYEESSPALGLGEHAGVVRPGAAVAWLPGACLVGRTHQLAGGFEHSLRIGEDVDLVWRLVEAGKRVRYDPSFEAHHDARQTLRAWVSRKFDYGTGGAALAKRHPDNVVTAIISPSMSLAALAVLAWRPCSVPIALAGTGRAFQVLIRTLPDTPERKALAARLSLRGLWWTLRQESALMLRHWWPLTLLAALSSRSARRALVAALVVDIIASRVEKPDLEPLQTFVGRRLDDLAYGAGLWAGAIRSGSLSCLKVKWARGRDRGSRTQERCGLSWPAHADLSFTQQQTQP